MSALNMQLSSADEQTIQDVLARMREAWAKGDGAAYASVFSDDAR